MGKRKVQQLSVPIENSRDRLSHIEQALGDAGINLRALNMVDSGESGTLHILVSDMVLARRVPIRERIPARVENMVALEIEDRPGGLAGLLKRLREESINIQHASAFAD